MDPSPFDDTDIPVSNDAAGDDDPFAAQVDEPSMAAEDDPFAAPADDAGADDAEAAAEDAPAEAAQEDDIFAAADAAAATGGGLEPSLGGPAESKEPTKLDLWKQEREVVIRERIQKSREDKEKALADAKDEVTRFYDQRQEQLEKTQKANRLDEENTKKDLSSLMEHGTMWQKVAKMVDLNVKSNEQRAVTRYRKLLLELKNEKAE